MTATASHSALAQAFLRVAIDLTARVGPRERHMMVVIFRTGARPRLALRTDLVRELRRADMHEQAADVERRRVRQHEILVWVESDECTGPIAVPVRRSPDGDMGCDLPDDGVIQSLIGDP